MHTRRRGTREAGRGSARFARASLDRPSTLVPSSRGMTLMETVVWIAIFVFAMVAVITSVLMFYRANLFTLEQAYAISSGQQGIQSLVKNLREATYAADGSYPVASIAPDDIVFYADLYGNGTIEKVHYYLDGTSLVEGVTSPAGDPPAYTGAESTSTISEYVRNLEQGIGVFDFYDASGTEITDDSKVAAVRYVKLDVIVNIDTHRAPGDFTLTSSATIRNLITR